MVEYCTVNLEFLPSIGIERPVVVQNVDERKVVADPDLIIVSIMRRSDFNSSGAELHVDNNRICDDWNSAIDERVDGKFSVKMLQAVGTSDARRGLWTLTVYLGSSGWTAIAVSPSMVSGRVVAMIIFSSAKKYKRGDSHLLKGLPDPSIGYAKEVRTPNSNFSLIS